MAKKKKINQSQYGGKILGRVDEKGNKIAFIQNPTDEEDIAPVKQTNNTWLKKGTLDDSGYAIENPIDAINRINAGILMTGVDALGQFGRGFLGSAEGVTDIAKTTTADVLDFFGADNKARKLRESAERTWGVNEQLEQALASDNGTGIDDMSFLGEKGKTVPQGLGTTMFSMTTGGLGGALLGTTAGASATSMALLGMSAAGNSEQEAIKEMKAYQDVNGFSDKEIYKNAKLYGVLSGTAEALTEMMFGAAAKGSKLLGIGTGAFDEADDAVINALTKRIHNNLIKTFTQAGLKATSEGFEEVASGLLDAFAKKITYQKDKKYWDELVKDENLLDSFLSGTFSAALSQAPGVAKHITTVDENGKLRLKSNNEIKDYITDLSTNEQKIADKVAESRFTEEMTNKEKSKIRKEVMDQLRNLELTSDEINKSLGDEVIQGEPADTLLHQIIQNENTKFNFDEAELQVDNKRVNKNATNVEAKIQQLANDFTNELNDIRNTTSAHKLFNEMKNVIQATGEQVRLTSYNELEKQGAVKLLTDEKGNPIRNKNGRLQYTDEKGNLIGINGFRSKDGIVLNSDSTRLFEATMGHEIGESIKANSQSDYKVLREIATELGKLDGTLTDETMKAIERTYGTLGERTDSYLDEYANDKLGELFTKDSELINRIGQKPTILRKIIDEVKYLVKRFTTKSAEGKKLLELQHNLENKLQESIRELNVNNKTQEGTQYSVEGKEEVSLSYAKQRFNRNMGKYSIGDNLEDAYLEHQLRKDELDKLYEYAKKKAYNDSELRELERRYNELLERDNPNQANETKYSLTDNQNNESEKITLADGRTYNNYYEYAKDITKNKDELAKELLFKHYSQNFDVPANSNETKFYHGTDATFDYDGLKVMDFDEQTMDRNYGDYFYITTDKGFSHTYGSQIAEFIIPNDKILSLEDYRQNYSDKTDDELFNDYWALEMPDNEYIVKDIKPIIDYSKQRANDYINQQENTQYSLSDSQGRELSEQQQEYFKDSKLRNKNGELEVVYHTSPNQFTVFDNTKLGENTEYSNTAFGFFVTPNKNFSKRFGDINQEGTKGNTMEMYANITNPITHPFYAGYKYEGEQLDNIVREYMKATGNEQFISDLETSADEEGLSLYQTYMDMMLGEDPFETADFDREELIKNGYDAVEFVEGLDKDVNYNVSDSNEPVSSYAVFDSNQLKNIDNTNPTSNHDIRYSLTDSQGRQLSKEQQEFFKDSKVRDDEGNLKVMYHGTPDTNFTIFENNRANSGAGLKGLTNKGFYFTDTKLGAEQYAIPRGERGIGETPGVKEVYLNMTNPLVVDSVSKEGIKQIKDFFGIKGNKKITFNNIDNYVNKMLYDDAYNLRSEEQRQAYFDSTGYDGVILKGQYGDEYVVFNSNQIKNVDNLNPTDDADIRYQLGNNEVAPIGNGIRSEQIKPQDIQDTIAPLQEQVQQLTDTITRLEDRIAPLNEQEADELYQETQRGFENEVAPMRENLTPEENQRMDMLELLERNNMMNDERRYEKEQLENKVNPVYPTEEATPGQALSDIRDIDEVGKRDVKAYQYEHPEVKPYFQEEARGMLNDLNNSIKGERFINESQERGQGTSYDVLGVKRFTSPEIAELLDSKYGYTYDDIRKGLNAIIEDHGAENIAIAKRIELVLDDNLRNGYTDWQTGMEVPPNQQYLNMLAEQEWQNYFDDINSQYPLEQLQEPQYNLEDEETDFGDVSIEPDLSNFTADDIDVSPFLEGLQEASKRQAERQQQREELNQKKEVKIPKQSDGRRAVNRAKGLLVNEFAVLDDYSKQTGNKDIKFKTDTYNNYQAIAQSNIETAQTDINGKAIGPAGISTFEEAKRLGLSDIYDKYLKLWANVDKGKQGKGTVEYTPKEAYMEVKKIEAKYPVLKKLGKTHWQYFRNARHNLVEAGVISKELSDLLGRMYAHYTPYISENADNYFTKTGELKPKATIKRAKGGAIMDELLSAEEAMKIYTKSEFNTIFGNDLYREIVNTSNDIVQLGGDDRGMQFVNADNLYADKDGYYLTAYENGEPITARISEDMYRTLTRESRNRISDIENTFSAVTKPLQAASKLRRNILTSWSPTFIAKNFIKDFQEGIFNSKYTKDFIKNYPSAFKELATNTELAQQFKSLYGSGLTMGQYDIDANNYNPGGKNRNFLKGIKNANELIELAPRYAEFKASIEHGASIQEAMYNAREVTTNFSRGGTLAKALNRNGFTFLNSSIQGFDKFIRNFSGENGAKGIVNSLVKAAIFGIAPAVFNELAFGSGDDKDEEYEALPDYIKDNYYIIKVGNGNFIRIPKGRVLSVFGSAARRTIEAMEGEKNAFEGYWNNVQQQIGINNPEENNIFAPFIQAMGGRKLDSGQTAGSAWYGGDIIPSRLQKERPEDQYDASIDKLSIWLGQHTGISPYKINYVLDQYTGGMGDIFLPTITPEANSDGSIIAPIKDQFTADTVTDNKYVSEFYDTKGKLYTGSKATDEDILKNKYMNSISSEMAKLYAERREIQADENLTKQQKYAKSQEIKAEINRLAKEGIDNYNNIITSNNYAKIGDTEYYKNANGQWTKVTDDVASLGLDTEEKSEYYKVKNDIYTTKKENEGNDKPLVVQDIINSNLTPDAKVNLYTSNYKDDLIQPLVDSGMDVDSYLTYKSQNFTADKDSNGKSISGSKKQKVFDYINSMDVPYEQKLILAKSEYNSFNDNNYEIIEYIENTGMDYDERIELYKALGFKVDGDSISW